MLVTDVRDFLPRGLANRPWITARPPVIREVKESGALCKRIDMRKRPYTLGDDSGAIRRLEIQDRQFAEISERVLNLLRIRAADRVVELGIGPGAFGRRILQRLGPEGVLVGVDYTDNLLEQARKNLSGVSEARCETVLADISELGPWLERADVVTGRTVLHHLPNAEEFLGRLRTRLRPGTRVGFIEPDFRAPIARIAQLEQQGRSELAPLRIWAAGISRFYQARGLSTCIGARLALTLRVAGYQNVSEGWWECPCDASVIENMLLFYEEVRPQYVELGIMTAEEIEAQKREIAALPGDLPPAWGAHYATCIA